MKKFTLLAALLLCGCSHHQTVNGRDFKLPSGDEIRTDGHRYAVYICNGLGYEQLGVADFETPDDACKFAWEIENWKSPPDPFKRPPQ